MANGAYFGGTPESGALAPGSRLGSYLLERQIGRGGMATVFTARDERLGRMVALKILAPALAADEAFRQRFVRESRAAAAVDDPHIIPLFEAGQEGEVLFLAMRYVPGGDVRALLHREGPLPAERAVAIISPVASALDAAHAAGLVHRDVKPANMLLDSRPGRPDHVYLSDFGLARGEAGSTGLTGTGLFLGTVDYAAPEQIDGRPVDGRADQYALACAAFEMLTAQPPFPRDQGMAVLAAHLSQPPPPVATRRAELPAALDAVFARALAKSPDDRYPSCGAFSDALREAAGVGRYDGGGSYRAGHPATEVAWPAPGPTAPIPAQGAGVPGQATPVYPSGPAFPPGPVYPPGHVGFADPHGPGNAGQPGRAPTRWLAAAIAGAAVVVAAAVVAVALILAAPGRTGAGAPAGGAASGSGSPAGSSPGNGSPGPSSPGPSSPGPSSPGAGPATAWATYRDPSGFTISLPPGWAVSSDNPEDVKFAGSPAGFVVVVAWGYHPTADALADWRQQARAKAASDPTYQQIKVQRVSYRGYNAADWEFINVYQGVLTHVIDRTFIVVPGHLAYAIELYGPDAQWQAVYAAMWQRLLRSFTPGH